MHKEAMDGFRTDLLLSGWAVAGMDGCGREGGTLPLAAASSRGGAMSSQSSAGRAGSRRDMSVSLPTAAAHSAAARCRIASMRWYDSTFR